MEIRLKKDNIVKIVSTEEEAAAFIGKGYKIVSDVAGGGKSSGDSGKPVSKIRNPDNKNGKNSEGCKDKKGGNEKNSNDKDDTGQPL